MEKMNRDYKRVDHSSFFINYMASDGKTFKSEAECVLYDEKIRRERYYNHLLSKRNWFQRLFNVKPDMSFYDEMQFKIRLGRMRNK